MAQLDDIYTYFAGIHDYLRPTESELYHQQRESERQHCGYSMHRGKPGTFRANGWVPHGQIIIFDEEAMEAGNSQDSTFSFLDGELNIENVPGKTWPVETSSTVMGITKPFTP